MTQKRLILCGVFLAVFIFLFNFGAPIAKAGWCHDFNVDLKLGAKSPEVLALKTALIKEGFRLSNASSDEFNQEIVFYAKAFQEKYRNEILTPWRIKNGTGFVGKGTRAKLNKLYGCPASQPPPIASSVTIISPNGGDKLTQGADFSIKWNSSGLDKVSILLINYLTGDQSEIINSVQATSGQYLWQVPYTIISGDKYKITVKFGKTVDSSDNYFSIVSAKKPLAPSLTLLSPLGGEQWEKGKTYSIRWLFQDIDKIDSIILTDYSRNVSYSLGNNIGVSLNSSSFDWTIPSYPTVILVGDAYKIKLESCLSSTCYSAQSSSYFSIIGAATTTSSFDIERSLADISSVLSRLREAIKEFFGR